MTSIEEIEKRIELLKEETEALKILINLYEKFNCVKQPPLTWYPQYRPYYIYCNDDTGNLDDKIEYFENSSKYKF